MNHLFNSLKTCSVLRVHWKGLMVNVGYGHLTVILNEVLVKICKPQESLQLLVEFGYRPLNHGLCLLGVCFDLAPFQDVPQE